MNVSENIFKLAAAGLILTPFSMVFLINLFHLESFHIGMKLRVAVCSLIYRKVKFLQMCGFSYISGVLILSSVKHITYFK